MGYSELLLNLRVIYLNFNKEQETIYKSYTKYEKYSKYMGTFDYFIYINSNINVVLNKIRVATEAKGVNIILNKKEMCNCLLLFQFGVIIELLTCPVKTTQ